MPLPLLVPAALRFASSGIGRGVIAGATGFALGRIGGGGKKTRRRRKKRLTQSDIMELTQIRNILGKTAAANAMPFYLGRGSG